MRRERAVVVSLGLVLTSPAAGADWPSWRGPHYDGTVAPGIIAGADHVRLDLEWRRPLGSGYSGIAVRGNVLVTLAADGDADQLLALDATTGAERWRVRLNDRTVGHDGSEDGPSSTPVVSGDAAYALGAAGRLVAVGLENGSLRWERNLVESLGATPSGFGFVTTPLVVDDLLVVATGGEAGAFTAFDRASGEVRWRAGNDRIDFQSPILAELGGQKTILALGGERLAGLDPRTGREWWSLDYGPGPRYSTSAVVPVADDRLLLNPWQDTALYRVAKAGDSWRSDEVWRDSTLDARLATSVWHDGHVYGFDGRFLACVDGTSGKQIWKSRPPGGSGLIVVDGHLVILDKDGEVVVARAAPDGYAERARVKALDGASVTYPSFSNGRIFVRNTKEIAAIRLSATEAPSGAGRSSPAAEGIVASLIDSVGKSDTPRLVIDDFLRKQPALPVIESEGLVQFLWRGEAKDVAIESAHLGWDEAPLARLASTDLWYASARLDPDQRLEYRFNVDFERVGPDPANPRRVPAEWGADYSVVEMPAAPTPAWLAAWHGETGGTVERIVHRSAKLASEREVTVWLPSGHRPDGRAKLWLVTEGPSWIEKGMLLDVLRHRVGRDVAPLVAVFVASPEDGQGELAGPATGAFVDMLADELVPELTRRFGLSVRAADHAIAGRWSGAYAAILAGLSRPEVFGEVAVVSLLARDELDGLKARVAATAPAGGRFHVAWNRYERWDAGTMSEAIFNALHERGQRADGGVRADSAGWGGWRVWMGEMLGRCYPADSR